MEDQQVVLLRFSPTQEISETATEFDSNSTEISSSKIDQSTESCRSSMVSSTSSQASVQSPACYENKALDMLEERLPENGNQTNKSDNSFEITWSNMSYSVKPQLYKWKDQKQKLILNDVSGRFCSGKLSAILGPSGAGKSTLVNCLLDKVDRNSLTGTTRVESNDQILSNERQLKIAIIPQQDYMFGTLTLNETLMFASRIKNSQLNWTEQDHAKKVSQVIKLLGLDKCTDLACNQLSGGQYKRASIAHELVTSPDVMILDEPTSGLDAVTCYDTIKALRSLIDANSNPMSIIVIIHQPDRETFSLFDHVYVLATGGRCVYEGPHSQIMPTIRQALDTVAELNLAPELDSNLSMGENWHEQNTARLLLECAAHKHGHALVDTMNAIHKRSNSRNLPETVVELNKLSKPTQNAQQVTVAIQEHRKSVNEIHNNNKYQNRARLDKRLSLRFRHQERRSFNCWLKHCVEHTRRSWITITRDPMMCSLQVALHIICPLTIAYCFYAQQVADGCPMVSPVDLVDAIYNADNSAFDQSEQTRRSLENLGFLFFQAYMIIFCAICMTSLTYPFDAHVLLKEYRNGWYDISSYFIGRTIADIPFTAALAALAIGISYHLTGQLWSPYDWRFFGVAALMILSNLVAQTHGLMCGALLMNYVSSAVFVAPASTCPLVYACGFLIRIKLMPKASQIFSEFSYFTHLLRGMVIFTYGFDRCPCDESDFEPNNEHEIPSSTRNLISLWIDSFRDQYESGSNNSTQASIDAVGRIVDTISRARTFGHNITTCDQVKSFPMLDFDLEDSDLYVSFIALGIMLVFYRIFAYMVLSWKLRSCF